ncbi:MAG: hypothetical protein Q9219_001995 [cf. Caloplaca sp. 3 TL-2023]
MPVHPPVGDHHPASDQLLTSTLAASAYSFLQPTSALHTAALLLAKRYLDPLALSATEAHAERLQAFRRQKRKRKSHVDAPKRPFCMKQVHLEGFRTHQVWEQARRVLDASTREVETALPTLHPPSLLRGSSLDHEPQTKKVRFNDDEVEEGDDAHTTPDSIDYIEDSDHLVDLPNGAEDMSVNGEDKASEQEMDDLDNEKNDISMGSEASSDTDDESMHVFLPDKHGLNDGFFSIDDFNKQSEFLENQDVRGEPDKEASDEEEIDWGAEPQPVPGQGGDLEERDSDNEDDADEDGPTFGNSNLNAVDTDFNGSDDDMPMGGMGASTNTNDIMYADFFAPPPRKATKSIRMRALPKTQPASSSAPQQDDDVERTIAAVRRDIFEDDLSGQEGSDAEPAADPRNPRAPRSKHEQRQAKLAEEIRRLEAANVAKRDWTLSGEARAADRPLNSLLEEDLEFERAGKPVPVITNEVSEDIEALIKRRIINREFDEVIRRRPGDLITGAAAAARRGRFELDDSKPQQSLAEVYEAEHLKRTDPNYTDTRTEKLKKEHAAIEAAWADISAKLDALSNWHFKPKPPQASITVVSDVPKVSMEDARPAAASAGMGAEESMLAPQEIYRPGEERAREEKRREVVLKSGMPVAREEMSREEKLRRRRREKERIRKSGGESVGGGNQATKAATTARGKEKAEERKGVVGSLKRGGVKVIGKKGELVDVEGKGVKDGKGTARGGGSFKL